MSYYAEDSSNFMKITGGCCCFGLFFFSVLLSRQENLAFMRTTLKKPTPHDVLVKLEIYLILVD